MAGHHDGFSLENLYRKLSIYIYVYIYIYINYIYMRMYIHITWPLTCKIVKIRIISVCLVMMLKQESCFLDLPVVTCGP